ncbi:MAG: helix-turn-helix transcriptional regulator [Lentisphaerae bacterium]|nr:helix-turn-helix transcriptional regulator [Lentisphaerota bacterium]
MPLKKFDVISSADPSRAIPFPDISIRKMGLHHSVSHWALNRRLSRFYLLYWNETPGAVLHFRDLSVEMTPDKMILIPPFTLVSADTKQLFVHNFIEFSAGGEFRSARHEPKIFSAAEYTAGFTGDISERTRTALECYMLIGKVLLALPRDFFTPEVETNIDPRIRKALDMIATMKPKEYSINTLCMAVNMSPGRFNHLFREHTGISPYNCMLAHRMELVWAMLESTETSIDEIAEAAGFTDRSHLSRIFKNFFHRTPSAARKEMKTSAEFNARIISKKQLP